MALASAEDEVTPSQKTIRMVEEDIPMPSTFCTVLLIRRLLSCYPMIIDRCLKHLTP